MANKGLTTQSDICSGPEAETKRRSRSRANAALAECRDPR
jgi:hypothetical protein